MRILGIDLAAQPRNTGVVVLDPGESGRWRADLPPEVATDEHLVELGGHVDLIGVDAPLGWPIAFVQAVRAHEDREPWPGTKDRRSLTHRHTDNVVRDHGRGQPMSASADLLGHVAMRCALLQRDWAERWGGAAPRDGSGRLVEVYPAAALRAWHLPERGYKGQVYQTHAVANQAFLSVAGKAAEGVVLPVGPVVVVDQIPADHPSKEIGSAFVRRYEEKYGAGTFSSFAGHAHDVFRLLEAAVPVALKTAAPGTAEFRLALRDALETNKEVVGAHGVYNMSAEDHFGLDTRGRVLVRIENGGYSMIGQ